MKRISQYVSLFVSLMMAVVCVCGCNEGASASSTLYEATSPQINAISSFASKPEESLASQTGELSPTSSALDEATSSQINATS